MKPLILGLLLVACGSDSKDSTDPGAGTPAGTAVGAGSGTGTGTGTTGGTTSTSSVPADPAPEAVTLTTIKIRHWEDDKYIVSMLSPPAHHGMGIAALDNVQASCADGAASAFNTELFYLLQGSGSSQFQAGSSLSLYYADPDTTYENQASVSTDLFWFGCDTSDPSVGSTFNVMLTLEDGSTYTGYDIDKINLP